MTVKSRSPPAISPPRSRRSSPSSAVCRYGVWSPRARWSHHSAWARTLSPDCRSYRPTRMPHAKEFTANQALPTAGRTWNGEGRGARPLADTSWVRESIDKSAHLIDIRKATAVWERALAADPHQGPAVRIHGDPMPGNFLATDGRLTGMVDVAQPAFGDPAADLQPAWVLFDEPARGVFLTAIGLDESARERGRGWAFEMAIGGAHYYEHTNAVFFEQAMRTLHRLLAE